MVNTKPTLPGHRLDKAIELTGKLLDLGTREQLGGDGEPVGVVLIYRNQAFLNASWGGNQTDRMAALVQAAAAEGIKDK